MKKLFSLMMMAIMAAMSLCLVACGSDDDEPGTEGAESVFQPELTLNVENGGMVATLIDDATKYSIKSIKITGLLNGTDIRCIREMAELEYLDIEDCRIIEGGLPYTGDNFTVYNKIGDHMFQDHKKLAIVKLPKTTTGIEDWAFSGCKNLKSVTIPEGVTYIYGYAFGECENLESVVLPNSLTNLGIWVFSGCKSLASVTLSTNISKIDYSTFKNCSSLKEITIPKNIKTICADAFDGCTNLTKVIIEDSPEALNYTGFLANLTEVYIGRNFNCSFGSPLTYLSPGVNVNLKTVNFGVNVTSISYRAFGGCTQLTNVTLPKNLVEIQQEAFAGCDGLTEITIPEKIKKIEYEAFRHCDNLKKVTIEGSNSSEYVSIGCEAFAYCPNLVSVTIKKFLYVDENDYYDNAGRENPFSNISPNSVLYTKENNSIWQIKDYFKSVVYI